MQQQHAALRSGDRPKNGKKTRIRSEMNYYAYEMAHAFMSPVRFGVQALRQTVGWPLNPMGYTTVGKNMVAACEVFENITRRYGKPEFGIKSVAIGGLDVAIHEEIVLSKPFCNLIHFGRDEAESGKRNDPKFSSSHRCRAITRRCCAAPSRPCCRSMTFTLRIGPTPATCHSPPDAST